MPEGGTTDWTGLLLKAVLPLAATLAVFVGYWGWLLYDLRADVAKDFDGLVRARQFLDQRTEKDAPRYVDVLRRTLMVGPSENLGRFLEGWCSQLGAGLPESRAIASENVQEYKLTFKNVSLSRFAEFVEDMKTRFPRTAQVHELRISAGADPGRPVVRHDVDLTVHGSIEGAGG